MLFPCKSHATNPATTQASNATTSTRIDRLGFDYAVIEAIAPPAAATNSSAKFRVFAIYQADTTTYSTADAVIAGTTNSTATTAQFVLNVHNNTSNPNIVRCAVDLRPCKRYLFVAWGAPGATNYTTNVVVAHLFRGEDAPDSTTEAGVATLGAA